MTCTCLSVLTCLTLFLSWSLTSRYAVENIIKRAVSEAHYTFTNVTVTVNYICLLGLTQHSYPSMGTSLNFSSPFSIEEQAAVLTVGVRDPQETTTHNLYTIVLLQQCYSQPTVPKVVTFNIRSLKLLGYLFVT